MKNIFKYTWVFALALLTINQSCNEDPIEIVKFDESYTPKEPKRGDRDEAPPINLLDTYTYFKNLQGNRLINKIVKKTGVVVDGSNAFEFVVMLNKGAEETLDYTLNVDQEFIAKKGYKEFPDNAYSLNYDNNFNVDEKSDVVSIEFNEEVIKNLEDGEYTLPLKSTFSNSDVKYLDDYDRFVLYIEVKTKSIPEGDNIDNGHTDTEISGSTFNTDITFTADINSNGLDKLTDNSEYTDWSAQHDDVLVATFSEQRKIIGVIFSTNYFAGWDFYKSYALKSMKVEVADGDDDFILQGILDDETYNGSKIYLKFKEPIAITKIRLSEFESHQENGVPRINEIKFVYEE